MLASGKRLRWKNSGQHKKYKTGKNIDNLGENIVWYFVSCLAQVTTRLQQNDTAVCEPCELAYRVHTVEPFIRDSNAFGMRGLLYTDVPYQRVLHLRQESSYYDSHCTAFISLETRALLRKSPRTVHFRICVIVLYWPSWTRDKICVSDHYSLVGRWSTSEHGMRARA